MLLVIPADSAVPGSPLEPWASAVDVAAKVPSATEAATVECVQVATEVLWALSGRQFASLRRKQVRVLAPACPCDGRRWTGRSNELPPRELARWGWGCGCTLDLQLPDQDTRSIISVSIDTTVVDPTGYRLDWGGRLVRLDGSAWPMPSSPAAAGLEVTYVYGSDPPAGGRRAARLLAIAYAKQDESGCKLPQRVTSINAEGVSIALDDLAALREGGTGIADVDMWVHSVNPNRQTSRPQILSPDSPRFRTAVPNP